jgi:flagellar motor switch/type III secretory pathway protein FliN
VEKALNALPYPWHTLASVAREAPALLRDARRAIGRAIDVTKISEVLGELLGERVRIWVAVPEVSTEQPPALFGPTLALATADDSTRVQIELETELARTLVARILGRPLRPGDPRAPTPPEIEGAVLAIVLQVARRAHGAKEVLRPLGAGALLFPVGERRLVLRVTVLIGDDAYAAQVSALLCKPTVVSYDPAADDLALLAELPISLGVVAALSSAESAEVFALGSGDVWMPGRGWLVARAARVAGGATPLFGRVLLAPPAGSRVMAGKLGEKGEIVLVGVQSIPVDEERAMATPDHDNDTATSEVILDAPLVVRVEIGAVTMTVREWASLGAGDIIPLGRRVSDPILLRAAGLEIGRGELVEIEGELGVRIRERVRPT